MTQWEIGDRVKLAKIGGSIPNSFGYKIGDTATIVDASDIMSIVIEMDTGPKGGRELLICSHEIEAASPTTPPGTIQHEGYNYTRGDPVVPDWVKDGAWVVHKLTGEIGDIKVWRGKFVFDPLKDTAKEMNVEEIVGNLRPFTNEDWKWGMWAEYKGEKVFVCAVLPAGLAVSKPTDSYFFALFSELTPTIAP